MSPTTLSQTPGRPTVNPPDPTPEARPEVGLHRPCSRVIQKPPAVLRPRPSGPSPPPAPAGCVKYPGRVRPTSAGTLRGLPSPPRPTPPRRVAQFSVLTSTGVPPAPGDLAGSGLFPTRAARTRGTHPGGCGDPPARPTPWPPRPRQAAERKTARSPAHSQRPRRPRAHAGASPPTPRRATLSYLRVAVDAASGRRDAQVTRSRPPGRCRLLVEARLRLPSDQWRGAAAWGGAGPMASLLGAGSRRLPGNPPRSGFAGGAPPVPRRKADSAGRSTRISLKQDVDFNCCHLKSGRRIARLSPTLAPGPGLLGSAMPGLWEGAAVTA